MPELVLFPQARFLKTASFLSSVLSVISIVFTIAQFDVVAQFLSGFISINSKMIGYAGLAISSIAYILFIYKMDFPKQFSDELIEAGQFEQIGVNKMAKTRKWIVITYCGFNIFANLFIENFEDYSLISMLIAIFIFIISVISYPRFKEVIRGSENIELIGSINTSYMMGLVYSLALGLGGDFYINLWIIINNLFVKVKKRTFRAKSDADEEEFWSSIVKLRLKDKIHNILSIILLFELIVFFLFFNDFITLVNYISSEPESLIAPLIYVCFIIISYVFSRINMEGKKFKNAIWILISQIILKIILLIPMSIALNISDNACRFIGLNTELLYLDGSILILTISGVSPIVTGMMFISEIADEAKNKKNYIKFKRFYIINEILIVGLLIYLSFMFTVSVSAARVYLFLFCLNTLLLVYFMVQFRIYYQNMIDILPNDRGIEPLSMVSIFKLAPIGVLISYFEFYYLSIFIGLIPFLGYFIFSVPIMVPFLISLPFYIIKMKYTRDFVLGTIINLFLINIFWAILFILDGTVPEMYGLSFLVSYIVGFSIIGCCIPLKKKIIHKSKK